MPEEDGPVVLNQTVASNEAVENVLSRLGNGELVIPDYQRDADQWDDIKKCLFIESVLNRITIPALYFAKQEMNPDNQEVVDGQQRLMTLKAFRNGELQLLPSVECPYYGNSAHYANKRYTDLADVWQRAFRRYNLTLVALPDNMELPLRLEVFRRINEGGTPLSGQDIRLSYYSSSSAVKLIQAIGVYNPERPGSVRILTSAGIEWPWLRYQSSADLWREWWTESKAAIGQTASEMFLWFLIAKYARAVEAVLENRDALAANLRQVYRGNTVEVLDIFCGQLRYEEQLDEGFPCLLPERNEILEGAFPVFCRWFEAIRLHAGQQASTWRNRAIAVMASCLDNVYGPNLPSFDQWTKLGQLLNSPRNTAAELGVRIPEPKGKWRSQSAYIIEYGNVIEVISRL